MHRDNLSLALKNKQFSILILSIFFQNKITSWNIQVPLQMSSQLECMVLSPLQQQAFHTWTFNLSVSWNSPWMPIHQMMTIIVFLSPLKSLTTLKWDDPTHQELGDPAEWELNVYNLIYAK